MAVITSKQDGYLIDTSPLDEMLQKVAPFERKKINGDSEATQVPPIPVSPYLPFDT